MFRTLLVSLFALALLTPALMPAQAQAIPYFEPADCPFGTFPDVNIDCGYMIVPADHNNPDNGDTLALAVAIIPSNSSNPEPDPIVYLEGGPGGSALISTDLWIVSPLRDNRDILLIDQRGAGYSQPRLVCDSVEVDIDATDRDFSQACVDDLTDQGIDLTLFTSAQNASDIALIPEVFGYDQINLFGVSYGTRLSLTIMRDHPESLRSVVLDSAYPPQVAGYDEQTIHALRAFNQLFDDCAASPRCNDAYPNLGDVFYETAEALFDDPLVIDLDDGEEPTEWDGEDFINQLFLLMYDTAALPYLPAIIFEARDGRADTYIAFSNGEFYSGPDVPEPEFTTEASGDGENDALLTRADELLQAYLGYGPDETDAYYDYLDNLSDDEYFDTLDDFLENGLSDDEFAELIGLYVGISGTDAVFDYLDGLDDDSYDDVLNDVYELIAFGSTGGESFAEPPEDSDGMFNSVTCTEEVPFNSLETAEELAQDVPEPLYSTMINGVFSQFEQCAVWPTITVDPIETEVVVSDIPTLVLAGNYDPITPPVWGQAAAEGLSTVYYFEFPGVGHAVIDGGDCPVAISAQFLDDPLTEPDDPCFDSLPPYPNFYIAN